MQELSLEQANTGVNCMKLIRGLEDEVGISSLAYRCTGSTFLPNSGFYQITDSNSEPDSGSDFGLGNILNY